MWKIIALSFFLLFSGCARKIENITIETLPNKPKDNKGIVYFLTGLENVFGGYDIFQDCTEENCIKARVKGTQFVAIEALGKHTYFAKNIMGTNQVISEPIEIDTKPHEFHFISISPTITALDKPVFVAIFGVAALYSDINVTKIPIQEGLMLFEKMKNEPNVRVLKLEGEYF